MHVYLNMRQFLVCGALPSLISVTCCLLHRNQPYFSVQMCNNSIFLKIAVADELVPGVPKNYPVLKLNFETINISMSEMLVFPDSQGLALYHLFGHLLICFGA